MDININTLDAEVLITLMKLEGCDLSQFPQSHLFILESVSSNGRYKMDILAHA